MLDEEGFASKEKMLKVGIGTIAALGIISEFTSDTSFGGHTNHSQHSSQIGQDTASPPWKGYHDSNNIHNQHNSY